MKTDKIWCMTGEIKELDYRYNKYGAFKNISNSAIINTRNMDEALKLDPRRYHNGKRKKFY